MIRQGLFCYDKAMGIVPAWVYLQKECIPLVPLLSSYKSQQKFIFLFSVFYDAYRILLSAFTIFMLNPCLPEDQVDTFIILTSHQHY